MNTQTAPLILAALVASLGACLAQVDEDPALQAQHQLETPSTCDETAGGTCLCGGFVTSGSNSIRLAVEDGPSGLRPLITVNPDMAPGGFDHVEIGTANLVFAPDSLPVLPDPLIGITTSQNVGTANAAQLTVAAQDGQPQQSGATNNDGGTLEFQSGAPGDGGLAGTGERGDIVFSAGGTPQVSKRWRYREIDVPANGTGLLTTSILQTSRMVHVKIDCNLMATDGSRGYVTATGAIASTMAVIGILGAPKVEAYHNWVNPPEPDIDFASAGPATLGITVSGPYVPTSWRCWIEYTETVN